mmetsp:Transcript_2436/g.7002  ORF Transcript_2436/g.7002 Transcript_2436/m.7002 type:complete len:244 (-) Transcript_2436:178-909(-)
MNLAARIRGGDIRGRRSAERVNELGEGEQKGEIGRRRGGAAASRRGRALLSGARVRRQPPRNIRAEAAAAPRPRQTALPASRRASTCRYEEELYPLKANMHEMWRESPVVAKLGFLWYDAKHAPPGHLILAHNLLRYDGAPGNSLPRGVKDLALWRDRCDVVEKTDLARCVGMRLHRKRALRRALRRGAARRRVQRDELGRFFSGGPPVEDARRRRAEALFTVLAPQDFFEDARGQHYSRHLR